MFMEYLLFYAFPARSTQQCVQRQNQTFLQRFEQSDGKAKHDDIMTIQDGYMHVCMDSSWMQSFCVSMMVSESSFTHVSFVQLQADNIVLYDDPIPMSKLTSCAAETKTMSCNLEVLFLDCLSKLLQLPAPCKFHCLRFSGILGGQ